MTRVAAPAKMCEVLSSIAVQKAREDVIGRGWKSSGALQPMSGQGQVGIRSTMKHLIYQDRGVKSFLMYWAEGRVVPIANKQTGTTNHVRGKGVGTPGFVNIPGRGRVWRDQKWKYPGLKPKRFLEDALTKAIKENRSYIQQELQAVITGRDKEGAQWLD